MKKKQPTRGKIRVELKFSWHPAIHPEDALNAMLARGRQKMTLRADGQTAAGLEKIMEDLWLASLANTPPEKWQPDVWASIQERTQKLGRPFWERLASATVGKRRRVPEFDDGDLFMLKNERKLDNPNSPWLKLPGLQDWNPGAAIKLMRMVGLTNIPNDEKSYNKKRRKLGLSAKHRAKGSYLVTDFRQRNDGQFEVVTKD